MGAVKDEIRTFLKKNRYCILCTSRRDEPRATPVYYRVSDDLTVFIYSENFTAKFKNLRSNPKVSLALNSQRSPLKGLQLWGTAEVVTHTDPRHTEYLPPQAKKNPKLREACKLLNLIVVKPRKIVMLHQGRPGGSYILWRRDGRGRESEQEIRSIRNLSRIA